MTPPVAQSMSALEVANRVRFARADARRDLYAGRTTPAELLASMPDYAERWQVGKFLQAIPGVGPKLMRELCHEVPCSPVRCLGDFTERQKAALLAALERTEGPISRTRHRVIA